MEGDSANVIWIEFEGFLEEWLPHLDVRLAAGAIGPLEKEALFRTGDVYVTAAADRALEDGGVRLSTIVRKRHRAGDWGGMAASARLANDIATVRGYGHILSWYRLEETGVGIAVLTEHHHRSTIVFIPGELPRIP